MIFLSFGANAQTDSSRALLPTITTVNNKYYINNIKIHYNTEKEVLTKYPQARAEYKKYSVRSSIAGLTFLSLITSGVLALINIKKEHQFFNPYTLTMFGSFAIGIPLSYSATKHENKAVCNYNRELMIANGY